MTLRERLQVTTPPIPFLLRGFSQIRCSYQYIAFELFSFMSLFPPDWGLCLIYLYPKSLENIWQTNAEMFVEWMLNLNVIALKVSGVRSQAMGIFFSL